MTKRLFDLIFSLLALIGLSPALCIIGIWVKFDSKGPVFFRQTRVTRHGKNFRIFKFRTMRVDAEKEGPQITSGDDNRITRAGRFLREHKLDELPQFINVLLGDMSIVGPRPEVPAYIAYYPDDLRDVILSIRPGITDRASIEFKDENNLLSASNDPEKTYVEKILPIKIQYYKDYVEKQTLIEDVDIILSTITTICRKKNTNT